MFYKIKNFYKEMYQKICKMMDGTEELLNRDNCSKLSMMDEKMTEDIYIIILQYFTSKNKGYKQGLIEGKEIPYSGKPLTKIGKGLNFKLSNIPDELQKIIYRYIKFVYS